MVEITGLESEKFEPNLIQLQYVRDRKDVTEMILDAQGPFRIEEIPVTSDEAYILINNGLLIDKDALSGEPSMQYVPSNAMTNAMKYVEETEPGKFEMAFESEKTSQGNAQFVMYNKEKLEHLPHPMETWRRRDIAKEIDVGMLKRMNLRSLLVQKRSVVSGWHYRYVWRTSRSAWKILADTGIVDDRPRVNYCPYCLEPFRDMEEVVGHYSQWHDGENPFTTLLDLMDGDGSL